LSFKRFDEYSNVEKIESHYQNHIKCFVRKILEAINIQTITRCLKSYFNAEYAEETLRTAEDIASIVISAALCDYSA
jgi:hypothetical protein